MAEKTFTLSQAQLDNLEVSSGSKRNFWVVWKSLSPASTQFQ